MTRTPFSLKSQILEVFEQALAEGQMAAADHLLCALEALDRKGNLAGPTLSEAYFSAFTSRSPN